MNFDSALFDRGKVRRLTCQAERLAARLTRPVKIMEVCGTHTHAIAAAGLRRVLPGKVSLVSGPGCPVCVTPVDYLDHAVALARRDDVIICTFGDLVRVPSSDTTLERESARGCDIRIVYSPHDAVAIAKRHSGKNIVLLGVGFETTLPTIAGAIEEAEADGTTNFLVLAGAKLIEPPLRTLVQDPDVAVDAFLLPGHVSVIVGAAFYDFLIRDFRVPGAIVGFAPVDIMIGIVDLLEQLATGAADIHNLYKRVVAHDGNRVARALLDKYFVPCDTPWRGLGLIPNSGLQLRGGYRHRDAASIPVDLPEPREPAGCRCGDVLKGVITPDECALFGRSCTPETPAGACMVSSEGTCAAWYRHERFAVGASL